MKKCDTHEDAMRSLNLKVFLELLYVSVFDINMMVERMCGRSKSFVKERLILLASITPFSSTV
jgi:hypothetical protein